MNPKPPQQSKQPADIAGRLQEPMDPAALAPHWADTLATDAGRTPDFLQAETIVELRRASGLPPAADAPLLETARRIAGNPDLRLLARHCYRLLYEYADFTGFGGWPSFQNVLGENAGVFYLLILLAAAPLIRTQHRRRNIPEEITRATCDRRDAVERYRATHQAAGAPIAAVCIGPGFTPTATCTDWAACGIHAAPFQGPGRSLPPRADRFTCRILRRMARCTTRQGWR